MRFSYQTLQRYFSAPLPPAEALAEAITLGAFEVENVTSEAGDFWLEIKVLPDRAADARDPLGMAREISAVLTLPLKPEHAGLPTRRSARAKIKVTPEAINAILGLSLSADEINALLRRARIVVEGGEALVPAERADINIVEDLADEAGRLYGLGRLSAVSPSQISASGQDSEEFIAANAVRCRLIAVGYSEVYSYTLTARGEWAVEKPLAGDKAFLRSNLTDGLKTILAANLQQTLFEDEPVKLFEIGAVFAGGEEKIRVAAALGYRQLKFKKENLPDFAAAWGGVRWQEAGSEIVECELAAAAPSNEAAGRPLDELTPFLHLDRIYQPISPYPRIIRDIAVWVPAGTTAEAVGEVIKDAAGPLLVKGPVLFDEFKKEGKVSYAFRLAFQSTEKTLTDAEANAAVARATAALESRPGWQVRR